MISGWWGVLKQVTQEFLFLSAQKTESEAVHKSFSKG